MKKGFVLLFSLFFLLMAYSTSLAEQIYFEGEGYIEPTAASLEPLKINNISSSQGILSAGDQVTVNVLATNFPNIVLYTTVRNQSGNPVTGLNASDFIIEEDGTAESITSFSESTGSCSGITVCLVFDVSGSMSGTRLAAAKVAANAFVNNCDPLRDRIGVVKFSTTASVVLSVDFVGTDNNNNGTIDIIEAINGLVDGGGTSVYNGAQAGVLALSQEAQPKAVIEFTDGATASDTITINEVITLANNDSVPLYTCGFYYDPQNLKDMAAQTGGLYKYAPSGADMQAFYDDIAGGLCSNYTISYTTHNPVYDGTTRTVSVSHDSGISTGYGYYVVNCKPVINLDSATLNLSNTSQQPDTVLNICGYIQDDDADTAGQNLTATFYYRHINSSSFTSTSISLSNQGNGQYTFCTTIPGVTVQEPGVEYYLHATDGIQETYEPFNYNYPYSIPVMPNHAPTITHTQVTTSLCDQSITINAAVVDSDSGDSVIRVALFYRTHDVNQITPYNTIEMTLTIGDNYSAVIPAIAVVEPGIDYYITAWDSYYIRSDHGTSGTPHFIQVNCVVYCTISLEQGWNMIGYCGQNSLSVSAALQTINGLYSSVWYYENGSWFVYDAQYPLFADLLELHPCHGYWINMNSSGTLILR